MSRSVATLRLGFWPGPLTPDDRVRVEMLGYALTQVCQCTVDVRFVADTAALHGELQAATLDAGWVPEGGLGSVPPGARSIPLLIEGLTRITAGTGLVSPGALPTRQWGVLFFAAHVPDDEVANLKAALEHPSDVAEASTAFLLMASAFPLSNASAVFTLNAAGEVGFGNVAAQDLLRRAPELLRELERLRAKDVTRDVIVERAVGERHVRVRLTAPDMSGLSRAFVEDITLTERLRSTMMENERLVALGTLAAGVGHELNNPLSYIATNLSYLRDVLKRDEPLDGETRAAIDEALADAMDGTKRATDIVRELKTVARVAPESSPLSASLGDAIHTAVKLAQAGHKGTLTIDVALGELPHVRGDSTRLAQVFLNLLSNAADAMRHAGKETGRIEIRGTVVYGGAEVRVRDDAGGIAPEAKSRIFEPFFSTKGVGKGTGLGLTICRGIVTSLGGHIDVNSEPGLGTEFRIWLPAALKQPTQAAARTEAKPGALRFLVIDDEVDIGNSLRRLLRLRGHEVTVCTGGKAGLEHLLGPATFDVVLCDLSMPEVTGQDVYETAVAKRPEAAKRIVFISGGAATDALRTFSETVDRPRLAKPFSEEDLFDAIATVRGA